MKHRPPKKSTWLLVCRFQNGMLSSCFTQVPTGSQNTFQNLCAGRYSNVEYDIIRFLVNIGMNQLSDFYKYHSVHLGGLQEKITLKTV